MTAIRIPGETNVFSPLLRTLHSCDAFNLLANGFRLSFYETKRPEREISNFTPYPPTQEMLRCGATTLPLYFSLET